MGLGGAVVEDLAMKVIFDEDEDGFPPSQLPARAVLVVNVVSQVSFTH